MKMWLIDEIPLKALSDLGEDLFKREEGELEGG